MAWTMTDTNVSRDVRDVFSLKPRKIEITQVIFVIRQHDP